MADHLVLVVHGIGEQVPGETVDQVLGGALSEHERNDGVAVDISHEVIPLPESPFPPDPDDTENDKNPRNPDIFPVHVRRVRPAQDGAPDAPPESETTGEVDRTVFAEVFWADKSPAPQGAFATILDLLKVLLGIGYLAMDNAENAGSWTAKLWVHAFTWIFFGAVAALNAVLLIGALFLMLEGQVYQLPGNIPSELLTLSPRTVILVVFALCLIIGFFTQARARTYMVRVFGRGLMAGALVPLYFLLTTPETGAPSLPVLPGQVDQVIQRFIEMMLFVMGAVWAGAAVVCASMYLVWLGDVFTSDPEDGGTGQRHFYASVCSAMILLWIIAASAFWLAFKNFVAGAGAGDGTGPGHSHEPDSVLHAAFEGNLENALQTMGLSAVLFMLLVAVAACVVGLRWFCRKTLYREPKAISRLLLNGPIQGVLAFSTAILTLTILMLVEDRLCPTSTRFDFMEPLFRQVNTYIAGISAALVVLATLVFSFADKVSGVLGIVRDIVAYATMARCRIRQIDPQNYPLRNEIENRFLRVYLHMTETVKPNRITVISHSQGTVVATRMLRCIQSSGRACDAETVLVTMGSPVTHLYRQYFPRDFAVADKVGGVAKWYNIFRKDDFVGTRIDVLTEGETDFPVPAGGHTGYFTDAFVWHELSTRTVFTLLPRS